MRDDIQVQSVSVYVADPSGEALSDVQKTTMIIDMTDGTIVSHLTEPLTFQMRKSSVAPRMVLTFEGPIILQGPVLSPVSVHDRVTFAPSSPAEH